MRKSTKNAQVVPVNMVLNGGLNYAQTPTNLADNELRRANNFIYDPATDFLMTRPGTVCQTAATCDGTNPILAIYYYEHSTTEAYLVAACNGHLYYLSGANLDAWTEIGDLTDVTTVPTFLTFNTKLLIADGGSSIRTWDGNTYGTLANSPKATALTMIKNRVVGNHIDEPDSVYLSAPNDETTWNTSTTAVGLKAGYGDNLSVIDFDVYGDDLIVFKKGTALKRTYRVNVASAAPSEWYVKLLSENNCSQNSRSSVGAWNNVFFVDDNGFKSLKGVQQYGDLEVDSIGRKINNLFTSQATCYFVSYIPKYNAIWFGMGDRVFTYTERPSSDSTTGGSSTIPAFTDLLFKQGRITSACQADDEVYLAGADGFLYKLSETVATDATDASTTVFFPSTIRTKTLAFGSQGILKKLQWYLKPKNAGLASINVAISDLASQQLKVITLLGGGSYLADATGYLAAATGFLYDEGAAAWTETTRNKIRSREMAFEIVVT